MLENNDKAFTLEGFKKISAPVDCGAFDLKPWQNLGDYRCLHLLIRNSAFRYGRFTLPRVLSAHGGLLELLHATRAFVEEGTFPYTYLTIDTGVVKAGEVHRTPGWHVNGLQGDEVPVKKPSDVTFTWCDVLPFEYAHQSFKLPREINLSEHNIFDCLGRRVNPKKIRSTEPNRIYAMDSYCVHRGTPALIPIRRTFIRVSYTHIPVTSTNMTKNENMAYDYKIHTTTGEIPKHLKTL